MVSYSRQQARKSLFHTVRFRTVSQTATVLSYIVLVRAMKEHAFGVYNLFYSFIPIITTLASFGLEQTLRRYQPEYLRSERTAASAWLVRFVRRARLASTVTMLGIILLSWNLLAPHFGLQGHRVDFVIFGLLAVLYLQSIVLQLSLASHMQHHYSVGSVAIAAVVKLAAYLAIVRFSTMTLRAAIIADIAAYGAGYIFLWLAHRRLQQSASTPHLDGQERKRLGRYALYNHFNDASSLLVYSQTDNFFIGAMLTPVAVATYAFYGKLVDMINNVVPQKLFDNIIQPLFFAVPAAEADSRLPRYFTLLIDLNLAWQLPALSFALVYHHEFVQVLFAGKYLQYANLLPLALALSIVPSGMSVPISLVAQYHERAGLMLASEIFGLYQVAAMLVLIPLLGVYGAALSTGSFHALRNFWIWWQMRHRVRWMNIRGVATSALTVWGTVALVCAVVRSLTHQFPPVAELAIGVVACAIGGLAYLRSSAISRSDRELLAGVMHGRERDALRWLGLMPRAHVATAP
ncbi:MAG TPA: lipopolysaccharide biosynthesis protein [Ktedonobacterales bacterium]|jgi:O-antigen/teichoic acid export membrane protein